MIKLIRNLANCDEIFFSGWILAHAQIILQGGAEFFSNNLLNATNRKAAFKVEGRDKDGDVRQSLKVLLVMPKSSQTSSVRKMQQCGSFLSKRKFTIEQINEYIALSGDKNIIHQSEKPIVPGFLMVLYLYEEFFRAQTDWDVKFLYPVYSGDEIAFYQQGNTVNAYVHDVLAFTIKFNRTGEFNVK